MLGDSANIPSSVDPRQFTADDTVRAIHNLFESRRSGGIVLTGGAIGGDLLAAKLATESEQNQNSWWRLSFGDHAVLFGIIAAPIAAVGIRKIVSYRGGRERRVIADFRTTHKLPYKIQRRLNPTFFAQPKSRPN
ncbi:hypothetical protein [Hymenobacter radiodurans]|uniref:hypothetical protein n=1 Tax=Hymenobacter radiodurans TaxID=2496028 RepID=UPI001058C034|nr:hypothetical protein [Hymenobacter radiodurans]